MIQYIIRRWVLPEIIGKKPRASLGLRGVSKIEAWALGRQVGLLARLLGDALPLDALPTHFRIALRQREWNRADGNK
jgi:hypothetical protein